MWHTSAIPLLIRVTEDPQEFFCHFFPLLNFRFSHRHYLKKINLENYTGWQPMIADIFICPLHVPTTTYKHIKKVADHSCLFLVKNCVSVSMFGFVHLNAMKLAANRGSQIPWSWFSVVAMGPGIPMWILYIILLWTTALSPSPVSFTGLHVSRLYYKQFPILKQSVSQKTEDRKHIKTKCMKPKQPSEQNLKRAREESQFLGSTVFKMQILKT